MILINNLTVFINMLKQMSIKFYEENNHKIKIIFLKETFLLSNYGEALNNKIISFLKKNENFKSIYELDEVLEYLDEKYKFSKATVGFIEDDRENPFKYFENFMVLNKSMLYLSVFAGKENDEIDLLMECFNEDEILEVLKKRNLLFNYLIECVLNNSEGNKIYSGVQLRVQDAYYMFFHFNENNLKKFLQYNIDNFDKNITMNDILINWQTKLAGKTNQGVDWKILTNVIQKISSEMFKQKREDALTLIVDKFDNKSPIQSKLLLFYLKNAINNLNIINNKWRRFRGYLHFYLYEQAVNDFLLKIKKYKNYLKKYDIQINKDLNEIIYGLEKVFGVYTLSYTAENKMSINLDASEVIYCLNLNDKTDFKNTMLMVHKLISSFIIRKEYNPKTYIYGLQIEETSNVYKTDNKTNFNVILKYSEEFGEYIYIKLEKAVIELIEDFSLEYTKKHIEDYENFILLFEKFIKTCDALVLENKLIIQSLKLYEEQKASGSRKKI